jgi:hypothetical protein
MRTQEEKAKAAAAVRKWRIKQDPELLHAANRKRRQRLYTKWAPKINTTRRSLYRREGWAKHIFQEYGLTEADFEKLLIAQGGRCAICKTDDPPNHGKGGKSRWHVDHDHKTNRVRGLLCFKCNIGIGHLNDDPLVVMSAINYLTRTSSEEK